MTSLSIGTMIAAVLGPILYPIVNKAWRKVAAYDERRIAEYEEKRDRKLAEKAARKATKLKAQKDRYTSATVVGPRRIGFDGHRAPSEGAGESDSQG